MEWVILIGAIVVIYWYSRNRSHKEAVDYVEENPEIREAENIDTVDPFSETLVNFVYKDKKDQFLVNSFPNIIINNNEKYKMVGNKLTLKLPPTFRLHFGVPYLKGEAWKLNKDFTLKAGTKYLIEFKPSVFVFSKPKIKIQEMGHIN